MANYTSGFGNWSDLEAVLTATEAFKFSTTYNNIDSAVNSLMSYASGTPSSSSWTTTTGVLYYPGGVTSYVYGSSFGSSNAVISRMDITNGNVTISMTGSVKAQDLSGAFTRADLSGYEYSEYQTGYLTINGAPAAVSSWGMTVPTTLGNVTFNSTGTGTNASGAWTWAYTSTSVTDAAGHSAQLSGLNFVLNQEESTPIDLHQALVDMLSGNDSGVGTAIAQELRGYAGDDFLDGKAGADTLVGGQGNDKYALDDVGDTIIENDDEGIDGVISTVAVSLPANVENLALTGAGAISGTGNDLGNRMLGNGSANILGGNGGNDVIDGRGGIDQAIFSGPVSGYSLASDGKGRIVVADTDPENGDDGTDTVTNIEELVFADTTVGIKSPVEATVSTDGFPQKSDIARTGEGYVVAWGADPWGIADPGIYAQRYDIDGNVLGVPMLVNSTGLGGTVTPSVSTLSDGGFVVAWSYTTYPTTATTGIFAQRFDANGVQTGSEVRIDSVPGWISDSPRIAGLANGGFIAAWTSSNGQDGDGRGIYARSYDSNGAPVSAEFRVNTYTTNEQIMPDVVALQDGGYMVTWTSYQPVANPHQVGTNIYAQRYNASGGAVGGETLINTNTSYLYGKSGSKLAALEDGGYVVAWTSHGQDGSGYGVYARRYDATGQPRGGEFLVNTTTAQGQYINDIAALDDGGYAITWLSDDGSSDGVFLQRLDINDQPVAGETQVNLATFNFQSNASISGLPDGGYGIVWGGIGPGTSWGLLKQQFDASGVELFPGVIHELSGGSSADLLNWAGNASVRLLDDAGDDSLSGGDGADFVSAGIGDDVLLGKLGNDTLLGGDGNDLLNGGRGADRMEGGNGNDVYVVDQRFDQIIELADSGIDSVSARAGHVLADNVENLYLTGSVTVRNGGFFGRKTVSVDLSIDGTGNEADNLLRGNRGHNQLDGLGGNDTLLGGAGADILNGGTGADRLVGGAGGDVFVFAAGDGGSTLAAADLLYDFEDGIDRIALAGGLAFADLTISQGNGTDTAAGNTVIGTGSGEYLAVLLNLSPGSITAADFYTLGI